MPTHPTHNVDAVDDLAAQFKRFHQRISALERASTSGASVGGYVLKSGDTMTGALNVLSPTDSGGANIVVGPKVGQTGAEGGQINFNSTSSYPNNVYIDRYQNALRFVYNNATVAQIDATGLLLPGNEALQFSTWGGGWYMSDASWLRTYGDKNIWANTGMIGCNGGLTIGDNGTAPASGYCARFGSSIQLLQANPTLQSGGGTIVIPNGIYASGGTSTFANLTNFRGGIQNDQANMLLGNRTQIAFGRNASDWSGQNFIINSSSGNEVGFAMWLSAYNLAPIVRQYGPFGERFDFCNNPSSGYVSLNASAFTVQSSRRIKVDITETDDAALLELIAPVRTHRFQAKIRPQKLRKTQRFQDIDKRWQATGRAPLAARPKDYESHDHDCFIDRCPPICPIKLNDTHRYGIIAEDLVVTTPEAVSVGEDGLPAGYDVDQVAAMAFGGVGALLRRIEQLQQRIEQLEAA